MKFTSQEYISLVTYQEFNYLGIRNWKYVNMYCLLTAKFWLKLSLIIK